jgi:hypothetical protein
MVNVIMQLTVKPTFKVSLGSSRLEHITEENNNWKKFNIEIIDLGSMKLNVK